MIELDLHGYKHIEVEDEVENFILRNKTPMRIITGNSEKMKKLVMKILEHYEFKYYIPAHNTGEIVIL
jgi:DNA-nicking Smr family endonuclease